MWMNRTTLNAFHEERDKLVEERNAAVSRAEYCQSMLHQMHDLKVDYQDALHRLEELQAQIQELDQQITEWRRKYADEVQKRFELLELLQCTKGENDARENS